MTTPVPTDPPRDDDPSLMRDACYPRPPEKTLDDIFDGATYYDWQDGEELAAESVEECLERWLDANWERGVNVREQIKRDCPVEITAYNRNPIDDRDRARWARRLAEDLREAVAEDFGDMDGDVPGLGAEAETDIATEFVDAIKRVFEKHEVHSWRCEEAATRVYSAEEVEKIMREHDPGLFEEEPA